MYLLQSAPTVSAPRLVWLGSEIEAQPAVSLYSWRDGAGRFDDDDVTATARGTAAGPVALTATAAAGLDDSDARLSVLATLPVHGASGTVSVALTARATLTGPNDIASMTCSIRWTARLSVRAKTRIALDCRLDPDLWAGVLLRCSDTGAAFMSLDGAGRAEALLDPGRYAMTLALTDGRLLRGPRTLDARRDCALRISLT